MTTYSLDLSTLRELLGDMPVLLSTPLPQGIPLHPYPSYGYIRLRNGKIDSCWIEEKNGFHLHGSLTEYSLQDKEQWVVEVEHRDQLFSSSAPPHPLLSFDASLSLKQKVFQHTLPLEEQLVVRMVYVMLDGHRTVEHMSHTLSLSSCAIEQALTTLQRFHMHPRSLLIPQHFQGAHACCVPGHEHGDEHCYDRCYGDDERDEPGTDTNLDLEDKRT